MLAKLGIGEREAREHSIGWIQRALKAVMADHNAAAALAISTVYGGTVGTISKEGARHMNALMQRLLHAAGLDKPDATEQQIEDSYRRLEAAMQQGEPA